MSLSASAQVSVTAANGPTSINVPTITWNTPAAVPYGTTLGSAQLNATANVPGTFVYTPLSGTVLNVGQQTLSVIFLPQDTKTYSAASASVQLTVTQAAPSVTWATPAPIAPGTALSATQLNATASVPGSFVYNPAAGAVLATGTQQLSAVFLPTDATDYSSVTATTSLLVGAPQTSCGGPTVNLNSGMSQSTLQSSIANAPVCSLIQFSAGTYNISAGLTIPCGVTITAAVPGHTVQRCPECNLWRGIHRYFHHQWRLHKSHNHQLLVFSPCRASFRYHAQREPDCYP